LNSQGNNPALELPRRSILEFEVGKRKSRCDC
jgi:hypothetical protein